MIEPTRAIILILDLQTILSSGLGRHMSVDYGQLNPQEAEESKRNLAEALVHLSVGGARRIDLAIECYNKELDLRYRTQARLGKRVHKGTAYYNLGLCYLREERVDHNKAVYNLLLAYVEDALSAELPQAAESQDAAIMLRRNLRFNENIMTPMGASIDTLIEEASFEPKIALDPRRFLEEFMNQESIKPDALAANIANPIIIPVRKPMELIINRSRRVFVGGNYATHSAVILKLKETVARRNLEPVVADDYTHPDDQTTHDFCLMLLHTCKFAIFDVTVAGGQYFEIERAQDYGIKPLVIFNADSIKRDAPLTSGVEILKGLNIAMKPYRDYETDLEPILREYLGPFV